MFSAVEEHSVKENWSPRQVHIKRVLAGIFLIRSSPVQSSGDVGFHSSPPKG
jgi:hypothetical protein